jgi:hypothetical protein
MSNPEVNAGVYPEVMDVFEARRLVLLDLIKTRFGGNQRAFAAASGIDPSYVNRMLMEEGAQGRRRMGDTKAEELEAIFDLPSGTLLNAKAPLRRGLEEGQPREVLALVPDRRHGTALHRELVGAVALRVMDVEASMGHGMSQPDHENVIMNMVINESWLRRHANFSSPDNLALVTGIGDSMRPTFEDGDSLLVDRSVDELKVDAIYVLALNDELFIKRIQRRPDGTFMMISDNKSYEPYHIKDSEREKFKVLGRVVMAWNSRRI